jgi:tetratricopeptide (TPR) repeat protein
VRDATVTWGAAPGTPQMQQHGRGSAQEAQRMRLRGLWAIGVGVGIGLRLALPAGAQTVVAAAPALGVALRAEHEKLEREGDLLGAAEVLERALARAPDDETLHWRIARHLVRHAEAHPELPTAERSSLYQRAREWAQAGRALAPDCAECCLYEFAGTARLATAGALTEAVGTVREAGRILSECLANPPSWRDASGSEEAALYYGASVYYRLLPDSEVIRWATGQRRDAARAVEFARRAVALERDRPRYRLELGAALLCDGARRTDRTAIAEGRRWLSDAAAAGGQDAARARELLADPPRRGCELSHDAEKPRS